MLSSLAGKFPVAILALSDGTVQVGESIGAEGLAAGEMVFHTGMAGYQEVLTDPGYHGQLLTMTYPHIGNTGVNAQDAESDRVQAAGLIIKSLSPVSSSFRASEDLGSHLKAQGTVAISGVDTRQVTVFLREQGAQRGAILALPQGEAATPVHMERAVAAARRPRGEPAPDRVSQVSTEQAYRWPDAEGGVRFQVVAVDLGLRRSTLRALAARGCSVTVVPAGTAAADVLAHKPDGILLCGGPGDPAACTSAIAMARELLGSGVPLFGLGLGHQVMALAASARTSRTGRAARGNNHPVRNLQSGQVTVTGQSHSYAVQRASLPGDVQATHVSLFDDTLQGLRWTGKPAASFQGTPDPAVHDPGDGDDILGRFVAAMSDRAA